MPQPSEEKPLRAALRLQGWHGYSEHAVLVIGETAQRYRIKLPEGGDRIRLPGGRWLVEGRAILVPKHAVKLLADEAAQQYENADLFHSQLSKRSHSTRIRD